MFDNIAPEGLPSISTIGVMASTMNVVNEFARLALRSFTAKLTAAGSITQSDICHILSSTSHSQSSRLLDLDLGLLHNRIESENFVAFLRFQLTIPQPLTFGYPASRPDGFDYNVTTCTLSHASDGPHYVDHAGNHTCFCASSFKGRARCHQLVNSVIIKKGIEAGYTATHEPATQILLGNLFDGNMIKGLFPKQPSAASRALNKKLDTDIDAVLRAHPRDKKGLYNTARNSVKPPECPADGCTVRADSSLVATDGTGFLYLVDASVCHTTSKSALKDTLKFHKDILQAERANFVNFLPAPKSETCSPQVVKAVKDKHDKYDLITKLLNLHAALGSATHQAKFVAAIMSHRGEMSGELIDLIECLSKRFKANERRSENIDGLTPSQATARFRADFKGRLYVALARGWALQLRSTGLPYLRVKQRSYAHGGKRPVQVPLSQVPPVPAHLSAAASSTTVTNIPLSTSSSSPSSVSDTSASYATSATNTTHPMGGSSSSTVVASRGSNCGLVPASTTHIVPFVTAPSCASADNASLTVVDTAYNGTRRRCYSPAPSNIDWCATTAIPSKRRKRKNLPNNNILSLIDSSSSNNLQPFAAISGGWLSCANIQSPHPNNFGTLSVTDTSSCSSALGTGEVPAFSLPPAHGSGGNFSVGKFASSSRPFRGGNSVLTDNLTSSCFTTSAGFLSSANSR
jgi:hypothetical protein